MDGNRPSIKDELLELFKELGISRDDYFGSVPDSVKRKYDRKVREWKEDGLLVGYFKFLVESAKTTYQDILGILIYGIYMEHLTEQFNLFKNCLIGVANDFFRQSKEEYPREVKGLPTKITWSMIDDWLIFTTINVGLWEYLLALTQTAYEETNKVFINAINIGDLGEKDLSKTIEKQKNRIISVKEDRFSGALESAVETTGNQAYVQPFPDEKVEFHAVMDKRTTEMCKSLNGQIFNSKSKNKFTRYFASLGGEAEVECEGLVIGLNEPKIIDHEHWCRSWLTWVSQ